MCRRFSLLAVLIVVVLTCGVMAEAEGVQYPVTVTDDMGREVVISSRPERLVSLAPSWTEILFALGLEDRVVGGDHVLRLSSGGRKKAEGGRLFGSQHRVDRCS